MSKEDPTKTFHSYANVHVYPQTHKHTSLVNTSGGTRTLTAGQKESGRCSVCFSSCSHDRGQLRKAGGGGAAGGVNTNWRRHSTWKHVHGQHSHRHWTPWNAMDEPSSLILKEIPLVLFLI